MTLEEATFDDLFKELEKRFPRGLVVAGLRPPKEGSAAEVEDDVVIANSGTYASIGLAEMASRVIARRELDAIRTRDIEEDAGEGEDEGD